MCYQSVTELFTTANESNYDRSIHPVLLLMDGRGRMVILTSGVYQRMLVTGKERFGSESGGRIHHVHIVIFLRAVIGEICDGKFDKVHPEIGSLIIILVNQLTSSINISYLLYLLSLSFTF